MTENSPVIFDLDGVLINSEPTWDTHKEEVFSDLFGRQAPEQIGRMRGLSLLGMLHQATRQVGVPLTPRLQATYLQAMRTAGDQVYRTAPLSAGVAELMSSLTADGHPLGIVSASPMTWVEKVIDRLQVGHHLGVVISLEDRPDLAHKPAPDGYIEATRRLQASPESSAMAVVIEDSNAGLASARAAGAYAIGFTLHLLPGYVQEGVHEQAGSMTEVYDIISRLRTTQPQLSELHR